MPMNLTPITSLIQGKNTSSPESRIPSPQILYFTLHPHCCIRGYGRANGFLQVCIAKAWMANHWAWTLPHPPTPEQWHWLYPPTSWAPLSMWWCAGKCISMSEGGEVTQNNSTCNPFPKWPHLHISHCESLLYYSGVQVYLALIILSSS